ncbi:MAG: helix-hairpin-helix domain-containing protein [Candidatus Cloacimonetes bacterium]|nr:helix-hairpin-helix domain-containing protein [Candidatus Cloacimonadota bacterium]
MYNPLSRLLTNNEQKILFIILVIISLGSALSLFGYIPTSEKNIQINEHTNKQISNTLQDDFQISYDLNNVKYDELLYITGIGPVKAKAIIDFQNDYGFKHLDDLLKVNGIGPKTFEKIKEFFFVSETKLNLPKTDNVNNQHKYDINTVSYEELISIKGIGPKKAQDILEYRKQIVKFRKMDELKEISGIGDKTFINLLNYLCIGE